MSAVDYQIGSLHYTCHLNDHAVGSRGKRLQRPLDHTLHMRMMKAVQNVVEDVDVVVDYSMSAVVDIAAGVAHVVVADEDKNFGYW